jgi:hypothetical protein
VHGLLDFLAAVEGSQSKLRDKTYPTEGRNLPSSTITATRSFGTSSRVPFRERVTRSTGALSAALGMVMSARLWLGWQADEVSATPDAGLVVPTDVVAVIPIRALSP